MATLLNALKAQITLLEQGVKIAQNAATAAQQQVPGPPNQAQWEQLLLTMTRPHAQPEFVPACNPVLSGPHGDIPFKDYKPPTGVVNIKSFKSPDKFTGHRAEADPFIDRCALYFEAKPNTMHLAKT